MRAARQPRTFDALAVLTRSGDERDAFCAALGDAPDVDAALVADVIRVSGRVAATASRRRELTLLCAIVRATDAFLAERIDASELRSGLAMRAAATGRFQTFGDARVVVRTLVEVVQSHGASQSVLRSQVGILHRELREQLERELTGSVERPPLRASRVAEAEQSVVAPWTIMCDERRSWLAELARSFVEGPSGYPVAGVAASAWHRGLSAAPVLGARFGDDDAAVERLARWLHASGTRELIEVALVPPPRWRLEGLQISLLDTSLPSLAIPATAGDIGAAAQRDPRPRSVYTDEQGSFFIVESDEYHVVVGPRLVVEAVCGCSVQEALATFREHVEALAVEGEPPSDLLDVAQRFGRIRRRGHVS